VRLGLFVALLMTAIAAVAGSAQGVHAAAGGFKTPAVGAHPKYVYIGSASPLPSLTVFGCQTRTIANPLEACYGPDQIQRAYGFKPLLDQGLTGAGRTIVIVDAFQSPTLQQDLALFDTAFNLPAPNLQIIAPDGLTPFNPADANQVGWSAEISLDVQWSHAVAPGANLVVVLAKSDDDADILSATKYALDHKLGDVLSQSFGEAEQCVLPAIAAEEHQVFDAMVAQNWTLFASSGDDGAAQPTCDGSEVFKAASSPASDPDVTGVGGTQLNATPVVLNATHTAIVDPGGQYVGETTWNEFDEYGAAGGSGLSVLFKRPDFQAPVTDSKSRVVPDVSYNAAINGGVIAFWGVPFGVGAAFRFGGTSAGSPQWSGLAAITDQLAGSRVGNINKTLYKLGKKNQSQYFHDVTTGDNSFPPVVGFSAGPGFDDATGWGSPIASALVPAIAKPGNG